MRRPGSEFVRHWLRISRSLQLAAVLFLAQSAFAAEPSFDCSKAEGTVQELICSDAGLAALDRELAEAWTGALANLPEAERATARAFQRGWIQGRDECWKSSDVAACVRDEVERRITELQIQGGLVIVPDYVAFECGSGEGLLATFYSNTKVPAAVLTYGVDDQVIAFSRPVAGGTLYEGRNVTYREHQGKVQLEWLGATDTCRPLGGATAAGSCVGAPAEAAFVIATSPAPGATVTPPFEVVGCSRTFESNVTWRLLARDGSVVAEGFTSGGGVDGPGEFRFVVEVDGDVAGLCHLEVDEPRISEEGFPPGRTVLPLVLAPAR